MSKQGTITSVKEGFFFIDREYFCHNSRYKGTPVLDAIVEYEATINNGKKNANNVKLIKNPSSIFDDYIEELDNGYFEKGYLKENLIITYPQGLANKFVKDGNKVNQVSKFYLQCVSIEGRFKLNKDFQYVKIELAKIIPNLNASFKRGHITENFYKFLEKNIQLAKENPENFVKGFMPHFQSLMGFYPKN